MTTTAATFGLLPAPISVRKCRSRSAPNCSRPYGCGIASTPLTLCATASAAALERSSTGSTITWLRTPTRPFSRRYPQKLFCINDSLLAIVGRDESAYAHPARRDPRDEQDIQLQCTSTARKPRAARHQRLVL